MYLLLLLLLFFFFFQAEDGIRDHCVTGVQTCALPIFSDPSHGRVFREKFCSVYVVNGV